MFPFILSPKCLRYIGSVYKHIRIDSSHIHFRNLSHFPNDITPQKSESTNSFFQLKKNGTHKSLQMDNLIQDIQYQFEKTGSVPKASIEKIIQHVVETAGTINTEEALFTLRCSKLLVQCTSQERVKLANTLWKVFNWYHIPIDVSHYNALLQVYIASRHEFSPVNILTDMKKQGILPNRTTYKYLLEYYCKNGNVSDATNILKSMKDKNYPINESILKLLILGYSEAGNLENAISVLDIMKKTDVALTGETYTAIMCAYAKINDIKSINTILFHCDKNDIQISNEQILDVIYTLVINNNKDHINKMFYRITRLDLPTTIHFLSKVMDAKHDMAVDILVSIVSKSQHEDDNNKLIHFFIEKLMHSNLSPESIINTYEYLETIYNDKKILNQAIYSSFQHDKSDVTLYLLKECKNRGFELRPHYFWPILTKLAKKNDFQGLLHNLKEMIFTYNVKPCANTIADYVIPHVFYSMLTLRNELHKYGIPPIIIDNAIVYDFLKHNKMRRAASYINLNRNFYEESLLKKVLQRGLCNTCDVVSFFTIITNMYNETESGKYTKVCINEAILNTMNLISNRTECISKIIKYLHDSQLNISNDVYNALSSHCKDNSSSNILSKLKVTDSFVSSTAMSIYKHFLDLKTRNVSISRTKYFNVVDYLLKNNLREESKVIMKHLLNDYPVVATVKFVLSQAQYLISVGYFDDAAELIENTLTMIKIKSNRALKFHLEDLLKYTTSKANEKEVNRLFNILLKTGYLNSIKQTMNLLVIDHIKQGNAIKALEISELLCEKCQYIPALTQLTNLIVLAEDKELLQRFIDITTKVYELQYILAELMLCFLKNDYEKEAKKIIKFFTTSNYTFLSMKENILKCVRQKNTKVLEKLLDCSVEYPNMNRFFIYKCLLHIYNLQNDHQSGLHLWTKVKEEGLSPTEDFIKIFVNLIERNNIDKSLIPMKIGSV